MTEDEVVFNDRWPDLKTKSCYTVLESLAYSLVFSAWCVFSPFHTQTTPTSSSLPLHPVDAPNKATCVVSGCLGERSPRQAACLCLSRDRLSPRCSVLFSLPFLLFLPQICHPCICLTHSSCLSHSFPTTPSHSSCLSLSSTLYCIHFISLCLIAFSTTFSSNKHKTSSFTYSLSH